MIQEAGNWVSISSKLDFDIKTGFGNPETGCRYFESWLSIFEKTGFRYVKTVMLNWKTWILIFENLDFEM